EPFSTDEALLQDTGEKLFAALFHGQVRDLFLSLYGQRVLADEQTFLRVRLDIHEAAPEVASLPWELVSYNGVFLATQTKTLFTRHYLNLDTGPIRSLILRQNPRVLLVIPRGSGLATDRERDIVTAALRQHHLDFTVLEGKVTVKDMEEALATGAYHILHFIGHGEFEEQDDGALHGSLRFNAPDPTLVESEDEEWVTDTRLQNLLGNYSDTLKLVVLNACKGATVAEARSGRAFIGTAPAILRARVPAVVAMQYSIRDDVAVTFAETFYKRLTSGRWAGRVDMAVTLARSACLRDFPRDRGFATPILYLRSQDGLLFVLRTETGEAEAPPAPVEVGETPPSPCSQPPDPGEEVRWRYRHDTAETLVSTVASRQERLRLLRRQKEELETLKLTNPLLAAGGMVALQIEDLTRQEQSLLAELEESKAVLCWKLWEACNEREQVRGRLEAHCAERERLKAEGRYVSFALQNAIANLEQRLRALDDVLNRGQEFCR
ncbi:MAG: CHAT domain-containing protein, partial [Caldilineales bacterium]|nr:CHAT domain-containing protein [Caldilineales bacterium]